MVSLKISWYKDEPRDYSCGRN